MAALANRAGLALKCKTNVCSDEREGESCGATSDYGGELKCVHNVCVPTLPDGANESPRGGSMSLSSASQFQGTHPFVGMVVLGGPSLLVNDGVGRRCTLEGVRADES